MDVEAVSPTEESCSHVPVPSNPTVSINEGVSKGDKHERSSKNHLLKQSETGMYSIQSTEQATILNRPKSQSIPYISSSQSIQSLSSSPSCKSMNSFSSLHPYSNHMEQLPALCSSPHSMSYHSLAIPSSLDNEDPSSCKNSMTRNISLQMSVSLRYISRSPTHVPNRLLSKDTNRFTSIPTLMSINRSI